MPHTLILGIGSVLRGDDGVGVRVAECLAGKAWPEGVRVSAAHQLLPEHAEWLSEVDRAIFVDAAVDVPPGEIVATRCEPADASAVTFHHLTPAALLAACATLYGRAPRATLVRIGVASTEASMALSADLERRLEEYCERVRGLL